MIKRISVPVTNIEALEAAAKAESRKVGPMAAVLIDEALKKRSAPAPPKEGE